MSLEQPDWKRRYHAQKAACEVLGQQNRQLREALEQMESPVTFSEAEAVLNMPMNMQAFIDHVDFANRLLTRRAKINQETAALAATEETK